MPHVKFVKSIDIPTTRIHFKHNEGDVVWLDDARAKHYVNTGHCERCDAPAPVELTPLWEKAFPDASPVTEKQPDAKARTPKTGRRS